MHDIPTKVPAADLADLLLKKRLADLTRTLCAMPRRSLKEFDLYGSLCVGPRRLPEAICTAYAACRRAFARQFPKVPTPLKHRMGLLGSVNVVVQEKMVGVCLPIFERDSFCTSFEHYTICFPDYIFIHVRGENCSQPSDEDVYFNKMLIRSVLRNETSCMSQICNGGIRVIHRVDTIVDALIFKISDPKCISIVQETTSVAVSNTTTTQSVTNNAFPCCHAMEAVLFLSTPPSARSISESRRGD